MVAPTGRPNGRPPKPTEVKRALGNPGHRPLPPAALPGEGLPSNGEIPKPPRELGKKGKEVWNTIWLAGKTWLSPTADLPMIILTCHAYEELEDMRIEKKRLKTEGHLYYLLPNGAEVAHPIFGQEKALRVQFTAWMSMLAMSPTDRARLGVAEVREEDEMDKLLKLKEARIANRGKDSNE